MPTRRPVVPDLGVEVSNLGLRAMTTSFAGPSPRRASEPLMWTEGWDAMADRYVLGGLPARVKALLRKRAPAEMGCTHVGDTHGRTLFARGVVVRAEVGRRGLPCFSPR